MNRPPKARIRQAFERAATSYDSAAQVQRWVCGRLAARLPAMITPGIILDAGCGTGYGLRLLRERFLPGNLIGLDHAPAMLAKVRVRPPSYRLGGDVEHLPLADACLGLYWSSLTLQWCDPAATLAEASRILWPEGNLAVATLGPGTFAEVREAFASADRYAHTLGFPDADAIAALAKAAGLRQVEVSREVKTAHYADLKSLLRAVKAIGANQLGAGRRPGLMSRAAFGRAEAAYEARRQPGGLPLTYDVLYLTAHKP